MVGALLSLSPVNGKWLTKSILISNLAETPALRKKIGTECSGCRRRTQRENNSRIEKELKERLTMLLIIEQLQACDSKIHFLDNG